VALANFASARSAEGFIHMEGIRDIWIYPFVPSEHGQPVARDTRGRTSLAMTEKLSVFIIRMKTFSWQGPS